MDNNIPEPPKGSMVPDAPPVIPNVPIPLPPKESYKPSQDLSYLYDTNKKMPQAIDLEDAVLGAMMVDKKGLLEVVDILSPEVFFLEINQIIFTAIQKLVENKNPVDVLTVSEELLKMNRLGYIGGDFHLIGLTQKVFSSAHIEFHARVILQKYIARQLIMGSNSVINEAYNPDVDIFDVLDFMEDRIAKIYSKAITQSDIEIQDDAINELGKIVSDRLNGIKSNYPIGCNAYDEFCGGLHKREMTTVAARPGMGKTSWALAVSKKLGIADKIPTAFFTCEVSSFDLKLKLAGGMTGIDFKTKIRTGNLSGDEQYKINEALKIIENSKLEFYDTRTHKNTHERIIKKIRELVAKGIKIIFIDYVQLIKLLKETSNRTSDLSTITRELKALSVELNIPIVLLAQLSREADKKTTPVLADLKQSGSIEEDSDNVIFIYRPVVHRIEENNGVQFPPHILFDTKFIQAKGRNSGIMSFRTSLDVISFEFTDYNY